MYSGTTITNYSGNLLGTHQKIDRTAYRVLGKATKLDNFPSKRQILYFEGRNGPDGMKVKSMAQDEPWHFIDPFDPSDTLLLEMIHDHQRNLVAELKTGNMERSAFEASWLAHAIVDGLTPAHHYPYEEEMTTLRLGAGIETRDTFKERLLMKGDTPGERVKNNWSAWGFKGLMVSHTGFEAGVSAIIAPFRFRQVVIDKPLVDLVNEVGFEEYYLRAVREVALWDMYEEFLRYGWTWSLSKKTRDDLVPKIIEVVAIAWYMSLKDAGLVTRLKK